MHGDFKYNLARMNLLKLGEEKNIELKNLKNFLEQKGITNISDEEIKFQVEHLTMEKYLSKKSEDKYELTEEGKKELEEVKRAIEKF